jgi:hypothetical protein
MSIIPEVIALGNWPESGALRCNVLGFIIGYSANS